MEARDLVAADWGGTSDPYVSVRYGNIKKRTKVNTMLSLCHPINYLVNQLMIRLPPYQESLLCSTFMVSRPYRT